MFPILFIPQKVYIRFFFNIFKILIIILVYNYQKLVRHVFPKRIAKFIILNNVITSFLYQVSHYIILKEMLKDILPKIKIYINIDYFMMMIIFMTMIPTFYKKHSKIIHVSTLYPIFFVYILFIFVVFNLFVSIRKEDYIQEKVILFNNDIIVFRAFVTMYPILNVFPVWKSLDVCNFIIFMFF